MIMHITNWIFKLRTSHKLERINYYLIIFFMFLYVFVIPSFGARPLLNYFVFAVLGILFLLVCFYFFLFKRVRFNKFLLFIPIFVGWSFLGTILFSHQFRGCLTLLLLSISFFVAYYSFQIIEHKFTIFSIVVCGIFVFSIYFIIHYRTEIINFASYESEGFRLGDFFDNQNDVALYCLVGFFLSIFLLLFSKGLIKLFFAIPSLSIALVGLTTGSRTFILASVLIVLILLYFKMKQHKFIYVICLLGIIGLFFVLINLPFMSTMKERLLKMIQTFFASSNIIDTSSLSRSIWIDYGVFLGSKHLLLGLGFGGFSIYSGVGTFTHSNAIELLCDFGLFGVLLFYSPYFLLPCLQIKNKNNYLKMSLPFFIMFFAISFSMVFFYNKMYYIVLALLSFVCIDCNNGDENGAIKLLIG